MAGKVPEIVVASAAGAPAGTMAASAAGLAAAPASATIPGQTVSGSAISSASLPAMYVASNVRRSFLTSWLPKGPKQA